MSGETPTHPAAPLEGLLAAYRDGRFPMADPDRPESPLMWFNPARRGVIPLREEDGLHIPRRLRERARSGRFRVTSDGAFEAVMRGCAEPRPAEPQTWIDERIIALYTALHRAGHAHSVEAWLGAPTDPGYRRSPSRSVPPGYPGSPSRSVPTSPDEPAHPDAPPGRRRLVGGLYGVHIGGAFFAESKFSRPAEGGTDASKVCLCILIAHLRRRGFGLLDVQFWNPHLAQFGCAEVPRAVYRERLRAEVARNVPWSPFEPVMDL